MEVFEDNQQRLHLALSQQQPLYCVQGAPAPLGRIELLPLRVINGTWSKRQERWQTAFLYAIRGQELRSFSRTVRGSSRSSMPK